MRRFLPTTERRSGFTLTEMLVAVALVLMIMLLLANVFEIATGTVARQKGMAENDQQARTVLTVIKQDLRKRTFRWMVPFSPFRTAELNDDNARQGYFMYSENDPTSNKDDHLAFTIATFSKVVVLKGELSPQRGRATVLVDPNVTSNGTDDDQDGTPDDADEANPQNYLRFHPNQPEGDDGLLTTPNTFTPYTNLMGVLNGAGMSRAAEVHYFLRGTNLIRRVLLLRDPYDPSSTTEFTPSFINGQQYGTSSAGNYAPQARLPAGTSARTFHRDFDYSAYYDYEDDQVNPPQFLGFKFNSIKSLSNEYHPGTLPPLLGQRYLPNSLGIPHRRFGHNFLDPLGRPLEALAGPDGAPGVQGTDDNNDGTTDDYGELGWAGSDDIPIGAFLTQETANSNFNYPGTFAGPGSGTNPYNKYASLNYNPTTNLVSGFDTEVYRRGEDVLLEDVIEFDVKIWDDGLPTPKFVNLGYPGNTVGFYHASRNQNRSYGNRYDTWHPGMFAGLSAGNPGTPIPPPYRPYAYGPDNGPGVAGFDDDGDNVADDPDELGFDSDTAVTDDIPYPLRAIQITVKFVDPASDLVRTVTITESLVYQDN